MTVTESHTGEHGERPVDGTGRRVFSIGHSNQPLDQFLELLGRHRIDVIVDVRSSPWSKYVPQFNQQVLQKQLPAAGIRYLFLGRELGGKPDSEEFYDQSGHVLYTRIAETAEFAGAIDRLERGAERYRIALLCSEENPGVCHRHLLIAPALSERGIEYLHIRGDGSLLLDGDISARPSQKKQEATATQLSLL
jgi:uncharacterized protein (DUF488 family)